MPRAETQPVLQEHVEDHHDAAQRAGEHDREHDARAVRTVPEQGRLHQRVRPARWRRIWYQPNPASTSTDAASIAYSQAWRAQRVPLRQREASKNMAAPASAAPGRSSRPPRAAGPALRPAGPAACEARATSATPPRAHGHVHREDHSPPGAGHVGADQPPDAIGRASPTGPSPVRRRRTPCSSRAADRSLIRPNTCGSMMPRQSRRPAAMAHRLSQPRRTPPTRP